MAKYGEIKYEEIRTGIRCVFVLHAHMVLVIKFRHWVFTGRHLARLEEIMRAVCDDFEVGLAEFNGVADRDRPFQHVHRGLLADL